VALEGEDVFARPRDRLDPLADRGQVRPMSGLIAPCGSHDLGTQGIDRRRKRAPGIALVGNERLACMACSSGKQLEANLAFVTFGRGEGERTRGAVSARRSHAV
jgi:hypothetical protein